MLTFFLLGINLDIKRRVLIIRKDTAVIKAVRDAVPIQPVLFQTREKRRRKRKIEKTTVKEDITQYTLEKSTRMANILSLESWAGVISRLFGL
jgi:hypothetical protein